LPQEKVKLRAVKGKLLNSLVQEKWILPYLFSLREMKIAKMFSLLQEKEKSNCLLRENENYSTCCWEKEIAQLFVEKKENCLTIFCVRRKIALLLKI